MSKSETQILKIFNQARKASLVAIVNEAKRALPEGWTINIAVGWGLCVYDDKGQTILSDYVDPPKRLPRGVRDLLKATATFTDNFRPANEIITNKGIRYPNPKS